MSNSLFDKIKYFMGFDDLEGEDEDFDEDEEMELPEVTKSTKYNNKVVNIHTNTNMKLVIHEPLCFDDAPEIIDDLKARKTIVVNLEAVEFELKKQIFDFLNGGLYALDGNIQKVTKDVFILAPNNVEIDSKLKEEIENKGLFNWK